MYDELALDTLGDKKTALFLIMSDTDSTFNFLISMVYTQLFNLLCDKADDVYGGKLPIHVRCLIDECANIGQIPNLEKLVATIRSREISACLVLQARSQLKAIYKDNADTIVGNMDSQIFLGGSEPTTLKDLSEMLGKETIDAFNTSDTRGNSPSYGTTFQKMGHELLSRDELAVLDGGKCILQLRGVRPFLSDKYDLTQHPNYKLTSDYDPKNTFDIEKYLNRKEKIYPDDEFIVVDAKLFFFILGHLKWNAVQCVYNHLIPFYFLFLFISNTIQWKTQFNLNKVCFFIHAKSSLYNRLLDIAKTAFQKQLTSKSTVF